MEVSKFWRAVNKKGPRTVSGTRCWLWTGCRSDKGYGFFSCKGKILRAHRVAWKITHGAWPRCFLLHRCDVRNCVRPSHMFVGTQSDNMRDMAAKNRSTHGENHASAKLTNAKVLAIKAARARGVLLRVLAKRYKVSNMTISRIGTNQRWKHLLEKK